MSDPNSRPRILCIADQRGWIFDRHVSALRRFLGERFEFVPHYYWDQQPYDEAEYDLVYALEWNLARPELVRRRERNVAGIRSHVAWEAMGAAGLAPILEERFGAVHAVSRRLADIFALHLPGVAYVTHGVDLELFAPASAPGAHGGPLRLGWAGNRQSPGDKGCGILDGLGGLAGVALATCGLGERMLSLEEMPGFYAGIDVYCCASLTEGSNNSLLEAAASGRGIVTTDNGTVPEYLRHGESAFIVERRADAFEEVVRELARDRARLAAMGAAAREAVRAFDWRVKALDYAEFFRRALEGMSG
ncbi:glycosyltransferase family 4 protein [Fundidesulfovibrio agrisoli]|uniref:glycosyltransferase family 4 protein n=1 Tax=Fundidesulfovibrio agrisoli TaxID=2922717 RepID=UPI001FAD6BC4|nr:glycosyltransferase family 4 protein [Fundidesulfovibrio agrisoli]